MSELAEEILVAQGGLNYDDDPRMFGQGDTDYRLNVIPTELGDTYVLTNIKGTTKKSHSFTHHADYAGATYTTLGSCYDIKRNAIYYFLYSDLTNHCIIRYNIDDDDFDKIVWDNPNIGLDVDYEITDAFMIDNWLHWNPRSSSPRSINVEWAYYDYVKSFYGGDGLANANAGDYYVVNGKVFLTLETTLDDKNILNRPDLFEFVGWCYDDWLSNGTNQIQRPFFNTTTVLSLPPLIEVADNENVQYNNIRGNSFQFTYRFLIPEQGYTVTAPFSNQMHFFTGEQYNGEIVGQASSQNQLNIHVPMYTDGVITNLPVETVFSSLQILFRTGDSDVWRIAGTFEHDYVFNSGNFSFYGGRYCFKHEFRNIESYGIADNADIEVPYNFLPIRAKAQTAIDGERSAYVGILEGRQVGPIDVDLYAETEEVDVSVAESGSVVEEIEMTSEIVITERTNPDGHADRETSYPHTSEEITLTLGSVAPATGDVIVITVDGIKYRFALGSDPASATAYADVLVGFLNQCPPLVNAFYNDTGNILTADDLSRQVDIEIERYAASTADSTIYKYPSFKTGAWHKFCLFYYDSLMRRSEAIPIESLYIESPPELRSSIAEGTNYRRSVQYQINHLPPQWASWYRFGYAGNVSISTFWQYNITAAGYISDTNSEYDTLSYVDISSIQTLSDEATGAGLIAYPNTAISPYEFEKGDRIRFITSKDAAAAAYDELVIDDWSSASHDYEITAFDPTTNFLYFNSRGLIGDGDGGTTDYDDTSVIVEIYRPTGENPSAVYCEIGELMSLHEDSGVLYHTGTSANQTSSVSADGYLVNGDAYLLARVLGTKPTGFTSIYSIVFLESFSISDFKESSGWGKGKAGYNFGINSSTLNNVRYSNKLNKNVAMSGLGRFDGLDYKTLSYNYGDVTAMRQIGGVLKVIFENNVASVLVNRTQFFDADGQSQVVKSDEVLGSVNYSEEAWGSVNPESVTVVDRNLYFFDLRRKAFVRNSPNGSLPVSDYKMRRFFIDKADSLTNQDLSKVKVRASWDDDHDMLWVGIDDTVDGALVSSFVPSTVRNNEVNNIIESSETNLIEITAINGNTLTLNYLPESAFDTSVDWFVLSIDSCNVQSVSYTGDYTVHDKIVSFDFETKQITLVSSSGFSVGNRLSLYTPWSNYTFLPGQETGGLVSAGGSGWRGTRVSSGCSWYNEEEDRYYILVHGQGTYWQIGFAYCDDLSSGVWTMGNSDAPIILNTDAAQFAKRAIATGNVIDNGDGTISFLTNGTDSSDNWNLSVTTMNKDCTNISFSSTLDVTDQALTGNSMTIYKGKYTILCGLYNADISLRTMEMWQSDTIDSGYTKTCNVYTTEYDGHDSVWLEGRSDGSLCFVENGKLYAILMGETRYYISGHKGRFAGLMQYNDDTNSWSIVNDFAPELINPNYFDKFPGEDHQWACGHMGNNQSFIKNGGKCYYFCTMLVSTDTYQIAGVELAFKREAISNPTDIVLFHEATNRWVTFVSPRDSMEVKDGEVPIMIGTASGLFSFVGEDVYIHNNNDTRCYLWDTQVDYKIRIYGGLNAPNIVKIFDSIALHTNKYLDGEDVQIPATINYSNGMESRLPEARFEKEEGVLRSDYLCNMKSTSSTATIPDLFNGDTLRGYIIYHDFVGDETDEHTLYKVDILTTKSKY